MMECPNCGFEISDLAIFCTNCGAQIKVTCPACGANTPAGAIFCSQCGVQLPTQTPSQPIEENHPLQPIPSSETLPTPIAPYERRVVTILFADIAGYSTLSENIDPEYLADIMSDAYPCLLEPINQFEGSIVQVMGDGVLAYFGVPMSREDDPERAILAGLEIVTRVQTYAKKLKQDHLLEHFHVRVGVNTGLVVVGEMNQEKQLEYIALGDAVNLAARLQQNAPQDGVLISRTTFQHIRGLFDVRQQGPLIVKGRKQVEQTYLVQQRKPEHLRLRKRGLEGVATAMVGREPEMAALKNIYKDAIQGGETALVLVSGDPGIGKTRLVREFTSWVRSQAITPIMLKGRAINATKDVPYRVLRNLFARSFSILETDTTAQALEKFRTGTQEYIDQEQADLIGQLVGFDFKASPAIQHLLGSDSFSEIAELYLKRYLRSLAEKSLLIIMEDLQWMDDRTLDLLSKLFVEFGNIGDLQMMILCTARTQFFEQRPKWGEGIQGFSTFRLRKLSRLQSRSLINEILFRVEDVPESFYQCVVDEAGGNPFFIEEMIKMFIDEQVISTKVTPWSIKLEKLADLHVPSTLKGILQARLDTLPLAEKQALQRAAVIGRTFWDGLLQAITDDAEESKKISLRLESLRDRGLIYHLEHSSIAQNQEYQFKHALLCDEAYESVLLKHRRHYHKQVAIWIEENAGDRLQEHHSLIANHYLAGGQKEQAADWFIKAGDRALRQSSMNEAKLFFEKALSLINDRDVTRFWQATLGHDEAVGMLGEVDARHADDKILLNLALKFEDDERLIEAYYRVGSQAQREGKNQEALRAFNDALDIANRNGDQMMQALILPMKIAILTNEGELDTAGTMVEEALSLARQTGNTDVLARALTNLAPYYQGTGDISKSVSLTREQIRINQQQGNRLGETYGLINLGYYYLFLGQFAKAHKQLENALKVAQRIGARNCVAYSLLNLGMAEWRLGQYQKACEVLDSSLDELKALGDVRGLASREFYLGLSYESANDLSEAANQYKAAYGSFKSLGADWGMVEAQAGLARLALQSGDLTQAEQLALAVISYLDQEGLQALELPILAYLSCVIVFEAVDKYELFQHTLEEGVKEIQDRLAMINEREWQEVFVEEIPENQTLLTYQSDGLPNMREYDDPIEEI